jgi:hypothetical protein
MLNNFFLQVFLYTLLLSTTAMAAPMDYNQIPQTEAIYSWLPSKYMSYDNVPQLNEEKFNFNTVRNRTARRFRLFRLFRR